MAETTLENLVETAFSGLSELLEAYDLEPTTENIATFSIVYGVNCPDGGIELGHATPVDFRFDTPICLTKAAEIIHERNVSDIAEKN